MTELKTKNRSMYAEYIAKGVRYALKETGLKQFPESTVLIASNRYSDLAQFDQIIGFKILVTEVSSPYDFFLAFNSDEESNYKLLKAFDEYVNLYSIEDIENESKI